MKVASSPIGLWTSSSPAPKGDVKRGLLHLKGLGLETVFPQLSRLNASRAFSATQSYLAGSDIDKVDALLELFENKNIKQVLSVRGGYGCLRLLHLLDRVRMPNKTPTLWGYSDLTVMQHYLFSRTHKPWVHSPMLSSGSFHSPNATEKRYWKKILDSSTEPFKYKLKNLSSARGPSPLKTQLSGLILGGNLASLVTLMGTPWNPRFPKGSFLFLEEISEAPYRLERLLVQLSYHQDFGNLSGVVAGHYTDCPRSRSILKTWSEEKNIPLWGHLQSGHERSNLPIVLGDTATLQRKSAKEIVLTLPKPVFGC